MALVHRVIRIDRLEWVEPKIRLFIDEKGHLVRPGGASASHEPFPFRYSIRALAVQDGQLIVEIHASSPPKEWIIQGIQLDSRLSSRTLVVNHLEGRCKATMPSPQGSLFLNPSCPATCA